MGIKYTIIECLPAANAHDEILPKAAKCKICNSPAVNSCWESGIGDICCSSCRVTYAGCHYSGKFYTKKRDAIKKWNEVNNGED